MVELVDTMDLKSIRPKGRCRMEQLVARLAHNQEVAGSSPALRH